MARIYTMPLRVRVSPDEYDRIHKLALHHHEPVSGYIRRVLAGEKLTSYLDVDAMDALHQAAITLLAQGKPQRETAQYLLTVSRRIDALLEDQKIGEADVKPQGGAA